jgi:chromosome partitioning protein
MIYGCYSIKGGVGKTALAVNLSAWLADAGHHTLLVDLDPQGAAGFHFSTHATRSAEFPEIKKDRLSPDWARRNIQPTDHPQLDLLPSSPAWRTMEQNLAQLPKPRKIWRRLLRGLGDDYTHIVLDAPPNLTLLSEALFRATDYLLIPVIPTPLSARTLEQLTDFFRDQLSGKHNRPVLRPFFSMVQSGKSLHRTTRVALREKFPGFLQSEIPFASAVERMSAYRQPLVDSTSQTCPAVLAYRALCAEVLALPAPAEANR